MLSSMGWRAARLLNLSMARSFNAFRLSNLLSILDVSMVVEVMMKLVVSLIGFLGRVYIMSTARVSSSFLFCAVCAKSFLFCWYVTEGMYLIAWSSLSSVSYGG